MDLPVHMSLHRTARSRQEIAALPDPADPACADYLRRHGTDLSAETLVCLLRESERRESAEVFELCGRLLVGVPNEDGTYLGGHCEPLIQKMARLFGFGSDPDLRREFRGRCHSKMWQAIRAGHEGKPFWEERFFRALKLLTIDVGRSMRDELDSHGITEFPVVAEPEEPTAPDGEDLWLANMEVGRLEDAIRRLPGNERRVAWMRWVEDYPVTDPDGPSITSVLGISDSMVRRYLRAARERLGRDPAVVALRRGNA